MFVFRPISRTAKDSQIFVMGGTVSGNTRVSRIFKFKNNMCEVHGTTLSTALTNAGASALNNIGFIFGGYDGSSSVTTIQRHTGETRSTETATLTYGMLGVQPAALGSKIFTLGGTNTTAIQSYDGSSATVESATLTNAVVGNPSATISTKAYVFGGQTAVTAIQSYDGSSAAVESVSMLQSRASSCASTIGSSAYLFGGQNGGAYLSSISKYDVSSYSNVAATLATSNGRASCSTMEKVIYHFGGQTTNTSGAVQSAINKFDGTTRALVGVSLSTATMDTCAANFGVGYK